jgi:hypothetical protein
LSLERLYQKRESLLDALRNFRPWFEDGNEHANLMMRDEIDDAIMAVKEL